MNLALLLMTVYTVEPTLELSSEIYETLIGMTTDVYPREKCIAPAIVLIVWTTDTKNGRGLAPGCVPIVAIPPQKREASHIGGTQERWVWAGTVACDRSAFAHWERGGASQVREFITRHTLQV